MSSNFAKPSVMKTLAVRGLASFPSQGVPVGGLIEYPIQTCTLPNKMSVVSGENDSLLTRVSVVFRAGSRYETSDSLGVSHVLRIAAGLSTRCQTQFAIIRNIQQVGATLTCSVDRETIAYTLEGKRVAIRKTLPFLSSVAAEQCFKPWEISDNIPRLKLELATRPPQLRAIDLLHKAAYHSRGLGHSIYIAKHNLNKISSETLQYYVSKNFLPGRCAVVGIGITHDELVEFANGLDICGSGDSENQPSVYKGGEIRSDKGGSVAHIAVAGKGGALKNLKEVVAFIVLQRALGTGTYIKYTNENNSPFAKLVPKDSLANTINAFNVSYSDCGLFGALISAEKDVAGCLLEGVVKILKSGSVSNEDFQRGKRQAQTALLMAYESGSNSFIELGNSAVTVGSPLRSTDVLQALDAVTKSDVDAVAKKVSASKLSVASVGNLSSVPFLDEIN